MPLVTLESHQTLPSDTLHLSARALNRFGLIDLETRIPSSGPMRKLLHLQLSFHARTCLESRELASLRRACCAERPWITADKTIDESTLPEQPEWRKEGFVFFCQYFNQVRAFELAWSKWDRKESPPAELQQLAHYFRKVYETFDDDQCYLSGVEIIGGRPYDDLKNRLFGLSMAARELSEQVLAPSIRTPSQLHVVGEIYFDSVRLDIVRVLERLEAVPGPYPIPQTRFRSSTK